MQEFPLHFFTLKNTLKHSKKYKAEVSYFWSLKSKKIIKIVTAFKILQIHLDTWFYFLYNPAGRFNLKVVLFGFNFTSLCLKV